MSLWGHSPKCCRISAANSSKRLLQRIKTACILTFLLLPSVGSADVTFTNLYWFSGGSDGWDPEPGLVQGTNGNLYGMTVAGGAGESGTIFDITPDAVFSTITTFWSTNGYLPHFRLLQGSDGYLYGTTSFGGIPNFNHDTFGTIFKISPQGDLSTLLLFGGTNGFLPTDLIEGQDGWLYGTTQNGGPTFSFYLGSPPIYGDGVIYKINRTTGQFVVLAAFDGTNGSSPFGALVQDVDGALYGTTRNGGVNGLGNVFKFATDGTLTNLFSFNGTNGSHPTAGLVRAADGRTFYGTTREGGDFYNPAIRTWGWGTVFKITSAGTHTMLVSFGSTPDSPKNPQAALIKASDGNFYGTSWIGGAIGGGTVFGLSPAGVVSVLVSFGAWFPDNGIGPTGPLVEARDGGLYATVPGGNTHPYGGIFRLSIPARASLQLPVVSPQLLAFRWDSTPGLSYQLQYNDDLASTNWSNLTTNIVATSWFTTNLINAPPTQNRFYRVVNRGPAPEPSNPPPPPHN
jgi:uncharacterized repeat protein (TIGR03803 family)